MSSVFVQHHSHVLRINGISKMTIQCGFNLYKHEIMKYAFNNCVVEHTLNHRHCNKGMQACSRYTVWWVWTCEYTDCPISYQVCGESSLSGSLWVSSAVTVERQFFLPLKRQICLGYLHLAIRSAVRTWTSSPALRWARSGRHGRIYLLTSRPPFSHSVSNVPHVLFVQW